MQANLILYNGAIHTMDPASPHAQAIAIAGQHVVALGDDAWIRGLAGPQTRAVDLAGRTVLPGFIDAHLHFLSFGLSLTRIDLVGVPSLAAALARVADAADRSPAGSWLQGRGWDDTLWPDPVYPRRADLDAVAPDHPVLLGRKCGHAAWANSRALAMAGIDATTADPPGGAIERDPATGQPTGILKENAIDLVEAQIGEPAAAEADRAVRAASAAAHRAGLTGVHTMEGADALRCLQRLAATGDLALRVLIQIPKENLSAAIQAGLQSGFGDDHLRIGGVKLFSDGSLGASTAHMLDPYDDDPGNCGIAVLTGPELRDLIGKASRAGIAVFVHAIGDRANREVLNAIEASRLAGEGQGLRHRIEHVQLLHPADVPRLARLGVVASMQPIHCTQDMLMAEPRWGGRCAGAYAWRSLLDAGTALAFGSDSPVESLDVMQGIHAAVTRRRPDGYPGTNGWYPEQRLSVAEAVYAYTAGAAYAGGMEDRCGTLSPGKYADLVVLSQDIFSIEPMAIRETQVAATMLDGALVYGDL